MKRKLTIFILEDDEQECNQLKAAIQKQETYLELVGSTGNSSDAITAMKTLVPDIIILDLELHKGGGNGILFLSELNQLNLPFRPYILVTTNNTSEVTLDYIRELGSDFILTKYEDGYSADYVVNFIIAMKVALLSKSTDITPENVVSPEQLKQQLYQRIHRELDLLGVSPKLKGYDYLTDAIYLYIEHSDTKISRILAERYHKTDSSIERAMQNAINRTWRFADPEDLLKYYTGHIRADKGMPTLVEFLSFYARKLESEI